MSNFILENVKKKKKITYVPIFQSLYRFYCVIKLHITYQLSFNMKYVQIKFINICYFDQKRFIYKNRITHKCVILFFTCIQFHLLPEAKVANNKA